MLNISPILKMDSYKASHWEQLAPGTTGMYSYIESRGGRFDRTLFFGLQMWLKDIRPITLEDINEAEKFFAVHGEPFNREGWMYILNEYGGNLPLRIKAVKEGTVLPTHNVMVTVSSTDWKCAWLVNYVETGILRAVWYATTVATVSWHAKQIIKAAMEKSSDSLDGLAFKLHDFGARGVSSGESAQVGGAAHLVNFMGSDTVEGILAANYYYNSDMAAFSIPAMEHSTVTSWGKENEEKSFDNFLIKFAKPGAIIAAVSDSYDLWNAVDNIWGVNLKEKLLNSGAILVVRPDSGDPLTIPVQTVERLGVKFGYTVNTKGFKVLCPSVRVIQGDGITIDSIPVILDNLLSAGWSADNLAFGMGGGLLQQVNRDTQKFAMKASATHVNNGLWIPFKKDPITDSGKLSKEGRFALINVDGNWKTINLLDWCGEVNHLETVWENGALLRDQTLDQIREISNNQ